MFHVARTERSLDPSKAFTQSMDPKEFYRRQEADQQRGPINLDASEIRRRQPFHVRYDHERMERRDSHDEDFSYGSDNESEEKERDWKPQAGEGEEGWRNSEGETLNDFGVDVDVEFYDEDDVPLGELMKQKNLASN